MKIAILTLCTYNNYGNRLQNYALQKFLSRYAEIVDTIWYEKKNFLPEKPLWDWKILIKCILNRHNMRKNMKYSYGKDCIKEYNIKKFSDKYIKIKYDYGIRENLNNEYDYFIVGSDQVWNPQYNGYFYEKFIKFAEVKKRIAYAASFGLNYIPDNKKSLYKESLRQMNYISVREKVGAGMIKDLINKDVPVLVDPTILISKEEWEKILMKPDWYNGEKYIFTYFLGYSFENKDIREKLEKFGNKYGYKVFNLMDKSNLDLYTSKVEEFLYLIKNASLVCTDSFHGAVFSIIMNTPFVVIERDTKNKELKMNSRIESLLELFGLKDRCIENNMFNVFDNKFWNVDFSNVEAIQKREIKRSKDFLERALNLKTTNG